MHVKKMVLMAFIFSTHLLFAMSFSHHDWEVTCDNTNTCRMVGYSEPQAAFPLSMLLLAKPKLNEAIEAKVQLGTFSDKISQTLAKLPPSFTLELLINHKSYGFVRMHQEDLVAKLSPQQTLGLLASLKAKSHIVFKHAQYQWQLSDKGSSAVLLKVDEYQKRLNTPFALLRKGHQKIQTPSVLKAMPIIMAQRLKSDEALSLSSAEMNRLSSTLKSKEPSCFESHLYDPKIRVYALNKHKLLASKLCWTAAYNMGVGYWVINHKAPYQPKLISLDASDYAVDGNGVGVIHTGHKGRGIGDCWSFQSHVWNGTTFVLSYDGHTGDCRAISAGGAWQLPYFVSKVKVQ